MNAARYILFLLALAFGAAALWKSSGELAAVSAALGIVAVALPE